MTAKPKKPFIVPVFIPHAGCPHRCVFCNQAEITRISDGVRTSPTIRSRISSFLKYKGPDRGEVQISFYGGNFLGLEPSRMLHLLKEADRFVRAGAADGIRFSTRPDTVVPDRLDLLSGFPVKMVEIGAQSMDEGVLRLVQRGHSAEDTRTAVRRLKARGIKVGLQMMVGLPGDSGKRSMDTAREIAALFPDVVRIYPTVVLRHSALAVWHSLGTYRPMTLDAAVSDVADLYTVFARRQIPVIRMGLQASDGLDDPETLIAGPYHPAFGHLVFSKLFLACAIKLLDQAGPAVETAIFQVHPANISKMRGIRNRNVEILKEMFHIHRVKVVPDPEVSCTSLSVICTGDALNRLQATDRVI